MKSTNNCIVMYMYALGILYMYITPFTDIVAPVFKYVRQNQCSDYGNRSLSVVTYSKSVVLSLKHIQIYQRKA